MSDRRAKLTKKLKTERDRFKRALREIASEVRTLGQAQSVAAHALQEVVILG